MLSYELESSKPPARHYEPNQPLTCSRPPSSHCPLSGSSYASLPPWCTSGWEGSWSLFAHMGKIPKFPLSFWRAYLTLPVIQDGIAGASVIIHFHATPTTPGLFISFMAMIMIQQFVTDKKIGYDTLRGLWIPRWDMMIVLSCQKLPNLIASCLIEMVFVASHKAKLTLNSISSFYVCCSRS